MTRHALALLAMAAALAACDRKTDPPAPTTGTDAAATAAAASAAAATTTYELAARGQGFSVGPMMAAQVVYVYFDPACPHCAELWQATQPLKDKLRMVWVPVGFLRSTSAGQGATILAAPDPSVAMLQNERSVMERGPGIPINPNLPEGLVDKVKGNTALLEKMGAQSVPFIVFKHGKTGQVGTHAGAMDTAGFSQLVGL